MSLSDASDYFSGFDTESSESEYLSEYGTESDPFRKPSIASFVVPVDDEFFPERLVILLEYALQEGLFYWFIRPGEERISVQQLSLLGNGSVGGITALRDLNYDIFLSQPDPRNHIVFHELQNIRLFGDDENELPSVGTIVINEHYYDRQYSDEPSFVFSVIQERYLNLYLRRFYEIESDREVAEAAVADEAAEADTSLGPLVVLLRYVQLDHISYKALRAGVNLHICDSVTITPDESTPDTATGRYITLEATSAIDLILRATPQLDAVFYTLNNFRLFDEAGNLMARDGTLEIGKVYYDGPAAEVDAISHNIEFKVVTKNEFDQIFPGHEL